MEKANVYWYLMFLVLQCYVKTVLIARASALELLGMMFCSPRIIKIVVNRGWY